MTQGQTEALGRTLALLARDLPRLRAGAACARIAGLRREAVAGGYLPLAAIAEGLGAALGRDRRGTPLAPWFDALSLAADCGAGDAETTPILLATVGVRLA